MGKLAELWRKIPRRWKVRLLIWAAALAIGFYVRYEWGVDRLLLVVLAVSFSAAWLREKALHRIPPLERWVLKVEGWTRDQFWAIVRGMALSVVLPTAWESFWRVVKEPSVSGGLFLVLVLAVIGVIYGGIERAKKSEARARQAQATASAAPSSHRRDSERTAVGSRRGG